MNAIILAAGRGQRLGNGTNGLPKCLLPFEEMSLIEHQIAALWARNIHEITVVVGYRASEIRRRLGGAVRYVENPAYQLTNSLYSLWLARRHLDSGFLLINGDVLFHQEILDRLIDSPYPDALAVQRKSHLQDEEMKVQLEGDRILAISKALTGDRAHGESLGLCKFSAPGSRLLLQAARRLIELGGARQWAPRAVDAIARERVISACEVENLPWIEIDFPEDLHAALTLVWPKIRPAGKAYAAA